MGEQIRVAICIVMLVLGFTHLWERFSSLNSDKPSTVIQNQK